MTLTTGGGWISMATKPLGRNYRVTASGAVTKRPPRMAAGQRKNQEAKARRLDRQWRAKSK
jgi:hypothetical protein